MLMFTPHYLLSSGPLCCWLSSDIHGREGPLLPVIGRLQLLKQPGQMLALWLLGLEREGGREGREDTDEKQ